MRHVVLAATAALCIACSPPSYLSTSGATMGTRYHITHACPVTAVAVEQGVATTLEDVNRMMSTYDPDSELSRFNAAPAGEWFSVSAPLVKVVSAAEELAVLSGGAFDVTVGTLVNLWGFGPGPERDTLPDEREIQAALERTGHRWLEARTAPPALRKQRDLYVDLSAIAKGYGVDAVARTLTGLGCTDYLVEIGGEVRTRGRNPDGRLWRIGVEVPDPARMGTVGGVVRLGSAALATSGDYRNFIVIDGRRYSHIIDPRTGAPVRNRLASVTVVHRSTMWADGFATLISVLGADRGLALAESRGLAVLMIVRGDEGFTVRTSAAFAPFEVQR